MKEKIIKKLQSKVVWITVIPLIASLIAMWCPQTSDQFSQVATTIVTILAVFGILNNPDDRDNF